MRTKISFVALCFLLTSISYAQEWIIDEQWSISETCEDDQIDPGIDAYIMLKNQDKPLVTLLRSMLSDSEGRTQNFVKLSKTAELTFWGECTAMFNTKVRFHYIWTGPEYRYYTTEWYDAKANKLHWISVITDTKWKKGTYKWIIIAEQKNVGSGAECVVQGVIRLY